MTNVLLMPLKEAINHILDSGVKGIDLAHQMGFQDTSMVYRYRTGSTKSCSAIRAQVIYKQYGILIDDYTAVEQLLMKVEAELSNGAKIAEPCQHLMDKLIVIASYRGTDLRSKLLRFIADHAGE